MQDVDSGSWGQWVYLAGGQRGKVRICTVLKMTWRERGRERRRRAKRSDIYGKDSAQHARASKTTYPSKRMGKCEDWRIFRGQLNLVYTCCMCGCTYAMCLSGVREKKAKSSTNGVPRDWKRERRKKREHVEDGRKISFHQLLKWWKEISHNKDCR